MKLSASLACVVLGLVALIGCAGNKPEAPEAPATTGSVRLLVIDDTGLAEALRSLAGQWKTQSGETLEVFEAAGEEARLGHGWPEADAVITHSAGLGVLAQAERIAPLSEAQLTASNAAWTDLFELLRLRESTWGQQVYAVPLGSPVFVLYYRVDLLAAIGREPPRTWTEYQELAALLADRAQLGERAPPAGKPWNAIAEPYGGNWAAMTFLARAAPYARHPENYSALFDFQSMEPLIAGPPFVRALDEMRASRKFAKSETGGGPENARADFWAGQCAMALTWSSARFEASPTIDVGVSELPGAAESYDASQSAWEPRTEASGDRVPLISMAGRVGCIVSECANPTGALRLLAALGREPWGVDALHTDEAITISRRSQLAQGAKWVETGAPASLAPAYAAAVQSSLSHGDSLAALPIPGRDEYLAALSQAIRAALDSEDPSESVLKRVATKWNEITVRLGSDRQRQAYQRSLGLMP